MNLNSHVSSNFHLMRGKKKKKHKYPSLQGRLPEYTRMQCNTQKTFYFEWKTTLLLCYHPWWHQSLRPDKHNHICMQRVYACFLTGAKRQIWENTPEGTKGRKSNIYCYPETSSHTKQYFIFWYLCWRRLLNKDRQSNDTPLILFLHGPWLDFCALTSVASTLWGEITWAKLLGDVFSVIPQTWLTLWAMLITEEIETCEPFLTEEERRNVVAAFMKEKKKDCLPHLLSNMVSVSLWFLFQSAFRTSGTGTDL